MNVLILTISFFVVFVAGMFTGREMLYLAEGRQRKHGSSVGQMTMKPCLPMRTKCLSWQVVSCMTRSKHWPKEDSNDQ